MTLTAFRCRWNMRTALTPRVNPVVTPRANTDHLSVIDSRRRLPSNRCMACFTQVIRIDMSYPFAARADPIVALHTVCAHARVIKPRTGPACRDMTGVAL